MQLSPKIFTSFFVALLVPTLLLHGCSSEIGGESKESASTDDDSSNKVTIIPTVKENFDASNAFPFAPNADGWIAGDPQDGWRTDQPENDGIQPIINEEDTALGDFGGTGDPWDRYIVNGEEVLQDYAVQVRFKTLDDDAAGLVFRWLDENNYYIFLVTRDAAPDPQTNAIKTGARADIIRIKDGEAMLLDTEAFTYEQDFWNVLRVDVATQSSLSSQTSILATVNGAVVSVIFDFLNPILNGKVGLWNFGLGSCVVPPTSADGGGIPACGDGSDPTSDTVFDDFAQISLDADIGGQDGLRENVELSVGTDPENRDTDGDFLLDGVEVGDVFTEPRDTDGDGTIDALDLDSDGDCISDLFEAGDKDLETPPLDSDLDEIPDYRDRDSNNDGVDDIEAAGNADTCDLSLPPNDCDGDGEPDYVDIDSSSCDQPDDDGNGGNDNGDGNGGDGGDGDGTDTTTGAATNAGNFGPVEFEGGGGCGALAVPVNLPSALLVIGFVALVLLGIRRRR